MVIWLQQKFFADFAWGWGFQSQQLPGNIINSKFDITLRISFDLETPKDSKSIPDVMHVSLHIKLNKHVGIAH